MSLHNSRRQGTVAAWKEIENSLEKHEEGRAAMRSAKFSFKKERAETRRGLLLNF